MDNAAKLIGRIGHYDSSISNTAKQELLLLGKKAVPYLVGALTNSNQEVVAEITRLLGLYRKDAEDAVEALATISYLNNPDIRTSAIASLGLIAEKPAVCIPVLKHHLKSDNVDLRRHAIAALGAFGLAANNTVYELVDALEDEDPVVREFAAGILYERGSLPLQLVKRVMAILAYADPYVRYPIVKLLAKMCKITGLTINELSTVANREQDSAVVERALNNVIELSEAS